MVKICTIGSCVITLVALYYAVSEYERYKESVKIDLLCRYNQRYTTDNNIAAVIKYILKAGITDSKGEICGVNKKLCKDPDVGIFEKEMFMRFFEELQEQIDNKMLDKDKDKVWTLFSYYAVQFDKFEDYRSDITDYDTENWESFRNFVHIKD